MTDRAGFARRCGSDHIPSGNLDIATLAIIAAADAGATIVVRSSADNIADRLKQHGSGQSLVIVSTRFKGCGHLVEPVLGIQAFVRF